MYILGSISEACVDKKCMCKSGVGGEKCDRCEPGYWGLPKISSNHRGCIRKYNFEKKKNSFLKNKNNFSLWLFTAGFGARRL